MERQALNVFRMRLLGAEVRAGTVRQPHAQGRRQRGHARLGGHRRGHALLPRVGDGPAPVPVDGPRAAPRDRRRGPRAVPRPARRRRPRRGRGLRRRRLERSRHLLAASPTPAPSWSGVEPAGGAAIGHGVPGVVHGMKSYLMQDEFGQVLEAQSISAGLDYPGRRPRARPPRRASAGPVPPGRRRRGARRVRDCWLATEGIIPALEPAHALAWVIREAPSTGRAGPCWSTCRAAATRTSPR